MAGAFDSGGFDNTGFYVDTTVIPNQINANGFLSGGYGTPTVIRQQFLYPGGFLSGGYGAADVHNYVQYVSTAAIAPGLFGSTLVDYRTQHLYPSGLLVAHGYGTADVSNQYRSIEFSGSDFLSVGTPAVVLLNQYLLSVGMVGQQTSYGRPDVGASTRSISPAGIPAPDFNNPTIQDRGSYVHPIAFLSDRFGTPEVRDRAQTLNMFGSEMLEMGHGYVNLYKRPVFVAGWAEFPLEADRFSIFTSVTNRNVYMRANGALDSRFSNGALVYNNAVPINPPGMNAGAFGRANVTHYVQYIQVDAGIDDEYITPYHALLNRPVLSPVGFNAGAVGTPVRVWSNLQSMQAHSTYDLAQYGRPWVSFSPQYLYPSSIEPHTETLPRVGFSPQYIGPTGWTGYVSEPTLYIHRNIISMWGYDTGRVGTPVQVYNVTPEVHTYSLEASLYGRPKVELLKRYVYPGSCEPPPSPAIPTPFVDYRTRTLRIFGNALGFFGLTKVQLEAVPIVPTTLYIYPPPVKNGTGSGSTDPLQWPSTGSGGDDPAITGPVVSVHGIFCAGWLDEVFGSIEFDNMAILQDQAIDSASVMGIPRLLGGTQTMRPHGFLDSLVGQDVQVVGPQIVDVGRIWDAGANAWVDHPYHSFGDPTLPAGGFAPQTVGPVFGQTTTITLKNRTIYQTQGSFDTIGSVFGTPLLGNRPAFIYASGWLDDRRGIPEVFYSGLNVIYPYASSQVDDKFGHPTFLLQDVGTKYVYPDGAPPGGFGTTYIVTKIQSVYPVSLGDTSVFSNPSYVGPYLRMYPSSADPAEMTTYGTPVVDFRVRSVYQLYSVDSQEPWADSKKTVVKLEPRGYYIEGSDFGFRFGTPDIATGAKRVYATGWEEFQTGFSYIPQFQPGLSHINARAFIAAPYTYSTEFGNGTTVNN